MKRFNLIALMMAMVLAFSFSVFAQAQDSARTQTRKQIKAKTTVQNKAQTRTAGTLRSNSAMRHGNRFIDLNGDGYNDNAPDADGDGIPNGMDPDYTGPKMRKGNNGTRGFIDLNGDGINDNALDADGDGIPNGQDPDYVRPMDGSGAKRMMGKGRRGVNGTGMGNGTGTCDGTGPKGRGNRGGGRR